MYIKRGKCLGVFQKRGNTKAGMSYEMKLFGNFLLVIPASDDMQSGILLYRKNSDENLKSLGVWYQQKDGTIYINSESDENFGVYVAEKIGDEYWMYDAK
jgi:hypothetical protein